MSKEKLIIHETDCHGCGYIHYNGTTKYYSYDDGSWGDVKSTIHELIEIGFINAEDVVICDDDFDIYHLLSVAIDNGLIPPNLMKLRGN